MTVEFFIGHRYLRTKQKKAFISLITFLSVAGMTVGVMALIVVIAVMAGAQEDLQERILNVNAHITLQSRYTSFSGYQEVMKTVEEISGVESTTPFITTQVMVRSSDGYSAAVIRGVDLASAGRVIKYLNTDPLIGQNECRKFDSSFKPGLLMGKELAAHLGLHVGDTVQLISPQGGSSLVGHLPEMKQYQVVGLFESGMYEYDRSLGFISLADAQNSQHLDDEVNGIEIRVTDISRAGIIRQQIEDTIGFPFWAVDWIQKYQSVFSVLELQKTVMFIILSLIVLVAAFNIASTLVMMVMEKKKDIAILRAMGATDRQVRGIFVFKGMVIGLVGTLLGDGLGLILCTLLKRYKFIELPNDVYFFSTLPVKLQSMDVLQISIAALSICFIATIYPARQASRMNPVEAIRNA